MLNPCNLGHFITRASLEYVVCILLPWDPQHPAPIVQTLPTWRITPVAKCQSEHLKFTWKLRTTFRRIHLRPSWEDFCSEIHLLGNLGRCWLWIGQKYGHTKQTWHLEDLHYCSESAIRIQNNHLEKNSFYGIGLHMDWVYTKAHRPSEPNPLGGILPGDTMMSSAWQQSF